MKDIQREELIIISRHSSLSEKGLDKALKEKVYNDKEAWQKFLSLFFISMGVGFTVSGIVFFFAYNWENLHKFTKLGLIEGLIIVTTVLAILPKINTTVRKSILTGAAVLVGVLFAVYGQIYQTGANAYDFFLSWTIFITLWVIVSKFAPLWLLYIILINTTFILYSQQVATDWSEIFIFISLFIINTTALITSILLAKYKRNAIAPNWLRNIVALTAVTYATIGVIIGIYDDFEVVFLILILITVIAYTLGVRHGLQTKSGFYLSVIPFSIIIMISAWLISLSEGHGMFLFVCLFIIGGVTWVIKNLLDIQKKWSYEK